jgi:DNA repair protein RadC
MNQVFILKESTSSIKEASDLFKKIKRIKIDYSQENFILFCLNSRNEVVNSKVLFKGGLDCCISDPKTIFREALLNNSCKIIVAHNHPSGNLKPSGEDLENKIILERAGDLISIKVLDFIIFNKKEFYSCK